MNIEEYRVVEVGNVRYIRSAYDLKKSVLPKVPVKPNSDAIHAPQRYRDAFVRYGMAYRVSPQNGLIEVFGRVGIYVRHSVVMLYTGDDILAAVLKPWAIKLFAPHELLELEAQNGIIWQINFDFYEDRVEFLVKCAFLRAEVVRPKRSLAVGGRNMEVDILERQITELKNDLVVTTLKRKTTEVNDVLQNAERSQRKRIEIDQIE